MKKNILLIIFCLILLTTACSQKYGSSKDFPYKEIKKNFISTLFDNETLVPGEGSEWDTESKTFIQKVYGSELLDPESDLYQEQRVAIMPNGMTSLTPPIHVIFNDIDKSSKTSVEYLFDKEGKLFTVSYRYIFELSQVGKYEIVMNKILEKLSLENTLILDESNTIPDMNTFDLTKDKLQLTWYTADKNQFIRMSSINALGGLFLDVTVCNKPDLFQ